MEDALAWREVGATGVAETDGAAAGLHRQDAGGGGSALRLGGAEGFGAGGYSVGEGGVIASTTAPLLARFASLSSPLKGRGVVGLVALGGALPAGAAGAASSDIGEGVGVFAPVGAP